MRAELKGTILALLAAVFSGIAIPLNKLFVVSIDPTVFTAVRAVIIGVIFLVISLYQSRPRYGSLKKAPWGYLLSIAVLGGAFAFLLYFNGLTLTTAGSAALLQKTLPLFVALLAFIFLRERISKKMAIAIAAMFLGVVLIYFTQIAPAPLWSNPSLGDLLILIATVLWAAESILAKRAMELGTTNFVVSFARMFFGGLILFGFVLLLGKLGALLTLSAQQWINVLISTALLFGYVLFWFWSIRCINVTKAATLLLLAPIISLAGGVLLFGEPIPALELAGAAVILVGAYYIGNAKSESRKKNNKQGA